MRAHNRQNLAIFTSTIVVILTIASSTLAIAQAPAQKKASAPFDKAVIKVQDSAKGGDSAMPAKAVVNPAAQLEMEKLLVRWERNSKEVKSLSVKYKRTDVSKVFGTTTVYLGEARLQSPSSVYLDFFEVVNGKKSESISERIVCDGKNVYQFLGPTRQVFVYPLDKDPEMKALNQGPLPFLFDMSVKKAKERYVMSLEKDLETYYVIRIIPKLAIDREEYSQAFVKLDKKRLLPEGIILTAPGGKETKTFSFTQNDLEANVDISPKWFDGPTMVRQLPRTKTDKIPNPWTVVVNPKPEVLREAVAPQGDASAGVIGTKPAAKGALRQK